MSTNDLDLVISDLTRIKKEYVEQRSAFVPGEHMAGLLKGLGATDADLAQLQRVSDDLPDDPTLPFRKSKNGRFHFDVKNGTVDRGEFQPFVLSAGEDFVRHDSGQTREFAEVGDDLQLNRAFQGLLLFKAFMVQDVEIAHRPKLDYDYPGWVCTLFNLRTVTTPELVGEPALEGVHSDGVDHTMTTLLGSENMTADSAITFLHDMRQINAVRWDEVDPELVVGRHQHRHFLDTMLVVDHERKHSLSPVVAADPQQASTRDMLIFFTRKPALEGHISHPHDSLVCHSSLPMSAGLLPPARV
ncbi:2OG-Fe dioxygenase family protein [Kitasatospora sp. NPDC086801]|uniref:2OG-Fe dioxygenase family protein n=1 Tax=Kitasatospora sp. NPDC086801 TaxID=3364066 RepID=UPI003824CE88